MQKMLLGDICKPKQWKTISTNMLEKDGYPVYGANGVIGKYSKYNHEKETLLITCRGATCGQLNISAPFSYINGNAMALDDLDESIDIKYLYYYLKGRGFKDIISGSAQPQIIRSSLEKIKIDLKEMNEQKAIVNIFTKLEAILDLKTLQLKQLDNLIKARFVEMFGDPVSNPKGLVKIPLHELGEFGRGISKHRPRNDDSLLGGEYPLIQTGDVANSGLYITEYQNTYSKLGLLQSKMWNKGTLCITIAANIAKTAILQFDACFPDSVVGFNANENTNNVFIHYWFSFFQEILEAQAPESAQKNINLKILSELQVIVPDIQYQKKFVEFVKQVDKSKFGNCIHLNFIG